MSAANYAFTVGGTGIFTIGAVTLPVIVDDTTKGYGDPNPAFTVTYVGFVNGDTAASLGGGLVVTTAATTGSAAGTYSVTPSGLTSPNYLFDFVDGTLTIAPAAQTITFGALGVVTYGDGPFDLTAASTSGLTVTFTASGSCSVSGVTVTITGAGTCTITAHQPGDANHAAAADVPQTLTIDKATPVVTWATPADIGSVYTPASGTVLTAGTHTLSVTFTPSDSANYAPVTITVDLDVLAAGQTIDFPPLDNVTSDHDPITLAATASSGLPVTYTVTGPCSVVGTLLTITGIGTCAVTAHQAGNANFDAAAPVTESFTVTAPLDSSISTDREVASPNGHVVVTATGFMPGSDVQVWIQPDGDPVTVTADANGEVQVTLTVPAGTAAGALVIEALGIDPNGAVLDLTKTITILALPSTSTIEPGAPGAPIGSILLVVLGLLLIGVAAGVNAMSADAWSGSRRLRR